MKTSKILRLTYGALALAPTCAFAESGRYQGASLPYADEARAPSAVGINLEYGTAILEHTEGVNSRDMIQLKARSSGQLDSILTISGRVVAIADAHWSNRANKFGYLMRHPSGNNQRTKSTQEMTISSAQLAFTFAPSEDFTGYVEMLYDPEQSFGAGTLTALSRNQVQVRKAYVLWGNLDKSPLYASLGKMDVPFGLQDSVNPFTNSTNWHSFAPLAYGGQVAYSGHGLNVRAMGVVGGAQFRSANTSVDGTAIPSKLNNFAVDASYTLNFGEENSLRAGASYLRGSSYCNAFPAVHFAPCVKNVPAWSAYARLDYGDLTVIGEYATTTRTWPATKVLSPANPLSRFAESDVSAFTAGARYTLPIFARGLRVSAEYSKYIAGPEGAPWRRQDQLVLGVAAMLAPSVSVFGEFINVNGFVPFNFISGGNQPDGSTWSDADAKSKVVMLGVKAGF